MRISGVRKGYGGRQVLRSVDLDVSAGTLVGVVGENGAGKSTLLEVAVGDLLLALTGCRQQQAGELSGGTREKPNLLIALMHDPRLLVLDEPYQGFDWDTRQRFWNLAVDPRDQGRSIIVVSHLLHDLHRFDAIAHLRQGRLHFEEPDR
ncbi:ATP-binding cassette domain-containing protein [Streptomyces sp. CA-251251]|uniref:ATP-binding cassette domain-containing protein n=1 Tax=Streptomyces sp. CA-251251 TaxID=3240063 RepID=UPI003D94C3E4